MIPVRSRVMFAASGLLAVAGALLAGPLNPPAGPVASTYKTLSEVEPRVAINSVNTPGDADSLFRITLPGSYYLIGNLNGSASKCAIKIVTPGVTIDLNGFTLSGVSGATQGILVAGTGLRNIAIRNGAIMNWDLSAVDTFSATQCQLQGLRVSGNGGAGLRVGSQSVISNCTAALNSGAGVSTQSGCIIEDCVVSGNSAGGISAQSNCVVTACIAESNLAGAGIDVFTGSTVSRCTASGNLNGIQTSGDCNVVACTARTNSNVGIFVGTGSTVSNCTVGSNTGDGIRVSSGCLVLANECRSNGLAAGDGAGVHATGGANRIEANSCTGADRGIDIDAAGNIISRNTCSGNFTSNWDVVAGNTCLVVQAAVGVQILGNSGGVAPGSTDPNANFTH